MNVRPIISIEQQQHICKIYMSSFMKIVLKDKIQYRILFEDYRSALPYLPYTNYISTFQDSNEIIVANFENYDITVAIIVGSKINVTNLSLWTSVYVKVYQSTMLILESMENSLNESILRFRIGRPKSGLVDYLTIQVFYDDVSKESFPVHVLPALDNRIFKTGLTEYVFAVRTIALPLQHSIIGLDLVLNGTQAQFFI
ncbi:unnamed protein product, partial [Rotaria sordida]